MAWSSFVRTAVEALICLLLLVLVGLEVQRVHNAADCGQRPVVTPTR